MSIQTIKYDTKLSPVAVDDTGNLVVDNAGNLVMPIKPIYITVGADDVDGTCGKVELSSDVYTFKAKVCESNLPYRKNTKHWLGKSDSIYGIQCVSNLRNSTESIVDFDIYAGIEKRRTPGKFDASGTRVVIRWGDDSVSSGEYYVCQQGQKTHYLGTVTVDLNALTLTYNTDGIKYPTDPSLIDCEQEETEEIVIDADYRWCSAFIDINGDVVSVTGTVYTEQGTPVYDNLVWSEQHNEIEISASDDYNEALRDAALTTVASSENRKFITCNNHTGIFWRDSSKDIILSYTGKTVYGLAVLGTPITQQTGMFVENISDYGQTDSGRVFSGAYTGSEVTESIVKQYIAEKLQIAENTPLKTPADYGVRYMLGYDNPQGYAVKTGNSVQLRDLPPDVDMGEGMNTYTTIYEWRTYDNSATFWLSDTASGRRIGAYPSVPYWSYDSDNGYVIKPDATVEVSSWLHGYCFELDGILYFALTSYNQGTEGLVFSADCKEAWSLSPCYQLDSAQNTVYTNTENPSVGNEYTVYDLASDYFWSAGNVTGTGEGTYSITGANGTTYYNSGYVGEATEDEEFE